jgi:hypothetical protein
MNFFEGLNSLGGAGSEQHRGACHGQQRKLKHEELLEITGQASRSVGSKTCTL